MDQDQFQKWLWEEAMKNLQKNQNDLFKDQFMTRYHPKKKRNNVPEWFLNIPKDSPKWICTLHSSVDMVYSNTSAPYNAPYCCPHVYRPISHGENNNFVVWKQAGHEFIKCFDVEIAQLIGTDVDPNKYELASKDFASLNYYVVEPFGAYKIIQPTKLAIQLAHKLGLEGSFRKYDEIILSLAKQVGDKLTTEHEKTFDFYEKLRNLALNNPEPAERFVAMERAYERGRKLIDQFIELTNPSAEQENEETWTAYYGCLNKCDQCGEVANKMFLNHTKTTLLCEDCRVIGII